MKKISRRHFLRLSGASTAGLLLTATGCTIAAKPTDAPVPTPTEIPNATPTAIPTLAPTLVPAAAPGEKVYRRPELVKFHPEQKSKVVQAHNPAVWTGDRLDPKAVRELVDKSIVQLTGIASAKDAWLALFSPNERIAIKVNVFRNSKIWTHPELTKAVTDSLLEAGIPGEQITVFDYYNSELKDAGYIVNQDGPGVRCYGNDSYSTEWDLGSTKTKLCDALVNADALINIPVLKSHMIAGMTFALKNHYGSVSYPDGLHAMKECLPKLNALKPIKDATRLVVGDILEVNTKYSGSWPYWEADARGDSIMMSYDPLAADRVGLDILTKMAEEKGNSTKGILGMSEAWFASAGEAGLGANDLANIDFVEI